MEALTSSAHRPRETCDIFINTLHRYMAKHLCSNRHEKYIRQIYTHRLSLYKALIIELGHFKTLIWCSWLGVGNTEWQNR